MKSLWLITLLGLSACSISPFHHNNTKTVAKIDYCLNDAERDSYFATHFLKPLATDINNTEPSGLSVLMSSAINARLDDDVAAKTISAHVLDITRGSPLISFQNIEDIATKLGYQATRHQDDILEEMRQSKLIMALSTDLEDNLIVISSIEDDVAYRIYPENKVCLLDYPTFQKKYKSHVLMLINKPL